MDDSSTALSLSEKNEELAAAAIHKSLQGRHAVKGKLKKGPSFKHCRTGGVGSGLVAVPHVVCVCVSCSMEG